MWASGFQPPSPNRKRAAPAASSQSAGAVSHSDAGKFAACSKKRPQRGRLGRKGYASVHLGRVRWFTDRFRVACYARCQPGSRFQQPLCSG
jgi:hypothetical protein